MKLILSFVALFLTLGAFSQDTSYLTPVAPNAEQIKLSVYNSNSDYFYPKLFERYFLGDTTLNLEEYRHLYYGYAYQDSYRPLETLNYADSITYTLSQNKSDSVLSSNIIDDLEYYIEKALKVEPFNLNYLNFMAFIKGGSGDSETAKMYSYKLKMVKQTIFSSGSGLSKDSPWHVLYNSDEQDILNSFGVKYSKPMLVTRDIEYFHLPIKNNGNRGYYFDISRRYLKRPEGEAKMPDKRFEFNPLMNPKSGKHIKFEEY